MDFMNVLIYLYDENREKVLEEMEGEWSKDCTLELITKQI